MPFLLTFEIVFYIINNIFTKGDIAMDRIYMIWDNDLGNTGIFFKDEKIAEAYCQLRNDKYKIDGEATNTFTYKEMELYNSMEDYKKDNKEIYKHYLKEAIDELKNSIKKIENSQYIFEFKLKDGFCFRSDLSGIKLLSKIVKSGKFKEGSYHASKEGYETFLGWHHGETRALKEEDLPAIEKGFKKEMEKFRNMKTRLEDYKKEYIELLGQKEKKSEELSK